MPGTATGRSGVAGDAPLTGQDGGLSARVDRPGPFTAMMAWVERRPTGGAVAVATLTAGLFAWGLAVPWVAGTRPLGAFDANLLLLVPYAPFTVAATAAGIRIARRALDAFWPATGWPETQKAGWWDRIAVLPFWPEVACFIVGAAGGVVALLSSPADLLGPEAGRASVIVAYLPPFILGYGLSGVGALLTIRWLRVVIRIHREAQAVDVFDRGPIYAFSRLTTVVALAYALVAYLSLTVNGAFQQGNITSLAFIGGTILAAILVFTVPMLGIHGRLERERDALLRDVEARTNRLAEELYRRIDAGQFEATKAVLDALEGTTTLRDRISRLPTWPWPPNVLRGFVSALIVPLVIFVLTRLLSGLI